MEMDVPVYDLPLDRAVMVMAVIVMLSSPNPPHHCELENVVGHFVVLETSVPTKTPFKQGYRIYTKYVLPSIGNLFSKDRSAYKYLSESASVFPHGQAFNNILKKIGFIGIENKPQTMGVASIYVASK